MRPLTTTLALILAAAAGGFAAHEFVGDDAAAPLREAVAPPARAALPAVVDGQPLPSLAPMLEQVTPAVVNIYSRQVVQQRVLPDELFLRRFLGLPDIPRERVQQSLGSGVIVDAERGYVLTNHHVIEDADEVSVTLADGRALEAEFIGSDPDTDVALIKIPAEDLSAVPLADSGALRVGDFVVAVGNPFGLGQTVTSGIVSALGRSGLQGLGYQNFIQTDASINPGNSGGALVNLRGELVGINSAIFNPRGSGGGNIGIGFAIPASLAGEVMRQLLAYGEVRRGMLGVQTQEITPQIAAALALDNRSGALVARVRPDSPAAKAGIRAGDVIVAANGQRVSDPGTLHNLEGLLPVGAPVRLELLRGGKPVTLNATLVARATEIAGGELDPRLTGATFAELPERYRQQGVSGVVVSAVESGSRAARNGLRATDLVIGASSGRFADLIGFRDSFAERPDELVLLVERGRRRGQLVMQ